MSQDLFERLQKALAEREAAGLMRRLEARSSGDSRINLADNDYWGMAKDPAVIQAAVNALHEWGASASASPLVTGYTDLHRQLEEALAAWHGYSYGLIFNSGYAANTAVLGGLPQAGDLVLADRLVHASMLEGILSSEAKLRRFPHNDLDALEILLQEATHQDGAVFVVTESVYSMDGDAPDLVRLADLRKRFGFCWILDEAHATGWYGKTGSGLQEEQGVRGAADIVVGTLGKGLGSQGAYVLCQRTEIRDTLINFAGEFIYSTYLAPACVAAALAAMTRVQAMSGEREQLHQLSREWRQEFIKAGYAVPEGDSPIIPVVLGDAQRTQAVAKALRAAGFMVSAIRPPTVPLGTARLRISLRRGLKPEHLAAFVSTLKGVSL
jgi:8-amino-7-oxononanoate synthase